MSHQQHIPASRAEATAQLRALFEAFPVDRKEGVGGAATYLIAVEGYSVEAIHRAVKRLIRGEVAGVDMRFLPTPAQVSTSVRYCEDLMAPVTPRLALPAPGSEEPTEEEWARRTEQAASARAQFGIKPQTGETVVDREAMPEALRQERDRHVQAAAAKLKGRIDLSEEARAIFRSTVERAAPSPDEQYDEWASSKEKAA